MNGQYIEKGADVTLDEPKLIEEIKNDLDFAWTWARPFLDRAVVNKLEHDNQLDPDQMPTRSKVSLPFKFAQVEEKLASCHDFLWPRMNTIEAVPADENISLDTARKVERGLYYMVKDIMKCPDESLPIERDCVKVGVGYGVIEPYTYQKLERNMFHLTGEDGTLLSKSIEMGLGELRRSLRLRYVSPGQIVPYPDGYTTNGPGRASSIYFLDFMSEFEFRNFVSDRRKESETLDFDVVKLSDKKIDEVIKAAKKGSNPNIPSGWYTHIKELGGLDYSKLCNGKKTTVATIPILRVYRENEHIWLANGDTIIYRQAARVQTLRCPIIKMSAVRDGTHWYPYNDAEAMRDANFNRNVWLNMVFDITSWAANRPLVWSNQHFDTAPDFEMSRVIESSSQDVRFGAEFLSPPGIGADTIQLGNILSENASEISGNKDLTKHNVTRGGTHAFTDLLNSMRGRERIAAAVMESGFIHDLFEQVLIYMQISGIGVDGNIREFNEDTGKEEMHFLSVDSDDFKNSFTLRVAYEKKYSADAYSVSDRVAIHRVLSESGMWDNYELGRFLVSDDSLIHRLGSSKEQMKKMQEEDRMDQRQAMQLGIQKARASTPQTPEMAGMQLGGNTGEMM